MKNLEQLPIHHVWKAPVYLLVMLMALLIASCGGGGSTSTDFKQENTDQGSSTAPADDTQDDLDTLGTIEDDPVTDSDNNVGSAPSGDAQAGRVPLVVGTTQRCAKVFEPIEVVITRQLSEGEELTESGELPNVTGMVKFESSLGTSLNLVSRTDESANFEMSAQDIVGLTSSLDNGSVTIFIAGYESESPERFIMRKPVVNGCLYAFKSDDYCSAGFAKTGSIAFSRNGVSMSAIGCELDNPDNLPVLEISASGG